MRTVLTVVLVLSLLTGAAVGIYVWRHNQEVDKQNAVVRESNAVNAEEGIPVTAAELAQVFAGNRIDADRRYLQQIVRVSGAVSSVSTVDIEGKEYPLVVIRGERRDAAAAVFNGTWDEREVLTELRPGDPLTLKCVVAGYEQATVLLRSCLVP